MTYAPIEHTRFEFEHPESNQQIQAVATSGWGNRVSGWAITMRGDSKLGIAQILLGIDKDSIEFKKMFTGRHNERLSNLSYELKNATDSNYRGDRIPNIQRIERIAAILVLKHLDSVVNKQPSPFINPEITSNLIVTAELHRPTVQSEDFRLLNLATRSPMQLALAG